MRAAWHLAINSLARTRNRVLLLAIAMAMATALTVAVASVMGTVAINLQLVLGQVVGLTDVRLIHAYSGRFDQSVLDQVRQWPEVKTSAARFNSGLQLFNPDNKSRTTVMVLGIEPGPDRALHPMELVEGRWIAGPGEILMDPWTQEKSAAKVGQKIQLVRISGSVEVTLVGVYNRPKLGILQQHSVMIDLAQLQGMSGFEGRLDEIGIRLADGVNVAQFQEKYKSQIPSDMQFQDAAGATAGINRAISGARMMLTLLTMLVFLSAAFIIMTSLMIDVAQRTREMAILRCVGATKFQVGMSQVFVGLTIALFGALMGTPLGLALSYALYYKHSQFLKAGFSFGGLGLLIAICGAAMAGLIGASYPGFLASRVSPLEALAVRARVVRSSSVWACLFAGLALVGVTAGIVYTPGIPDAPRMGLYSTVGLPAAFIGFFLLGVPLMVLATLVFGRVIEVVLRVPRRLVTQNIRATPMRFGFTAGALMVSLAMLVSLWTGGRSLITGWLDRIQMPDGFAHSYYALTDEQWDKLKSTPGVTAACPTTMFPVRMPAEAVFGIKGIAPTNTSFVSFDPQTFFDMAPLEFVQGTKEEAVKRLSEGNALLVSREYLIAHNTGVGSKLTFKTREGPVVFDVVGVVASPGLDMAVAFFGIQRAYNDAAVSSVFGSRKDAIRYFGIDATNLVLMAFDPKISDDKILGSIRRNVSGVVAGSARRIKFEILRSSNHALKVMSSIALATLLIACIGVGNLIIAGIASRRFELGVLRAVGASRWLLARLVVGETLLVAVVGCVLGTGLGVMLAVFGQTFHERFLGISYSAHVAWDSVLWGSLAVGGAAVLSAVPAMIGLLRTSTRAMIAAE